MQITGSAVANIQKISGFVDKLFNKTAKVNIALMGDSTTVKDGHGWDAGVVEGLLAIGLNRHGTGLISAGETLAGGHGHAQSTLPGNAVPSTTSNNGFTGNLPPEWSPYLTNWGTDLKPLLTQDSFFTYMGSMRPFCVTAGITNTSGSSFRYTLNGNEGIHSFGRPFEGITGPLNFQHWYLKRDTATTTGGAITGIYVVKNSSTVQGQAFSINNFNGVAAMVNGTTFSMTLGLTTTAPITLTSDGSVLRSRVIAALTGSGFFVTTDAGETLITPSSTGSANVLFSGDFTMLLGFTASAPTLTLNLQGLTGRYFDNSLYTTGLTSQVRVRDAGGFYSQINQAGVYFGLTESGKTLNVTGPQHLERFTIGLGASASRNYNIGVNWTGSTVGGRGALTGPWCSMFNAASISGATQGFSTTTMMYLGGLGAARHARALKNQSYQFLGTIFQALAEHAGYTSPAEAPLLIRVAGGVNDINDASIPSVGPSAGLASNTREGLRDNWQAMIDHVHAAYAFYGWTASNLYWLFTPSPATTADNSNLIFAHNAALDVSNNNPRTAYASLFTVIGGTSDIDTLSMYNNPTSVDIYHHSYTGYKVYSQYEWGSIQQRYSEYTANTAPVARLSYSPSTVYADQYGTYADGIIVNGLSSSDNEGAISSYIFNWSGPLGATSATVAGGTASISLSAGLTNSVTLTVVDSNGATGATTINIPVLSNRAPAASFNANPGFATLIGQGITFTSTSTDPGAGSISAYAWNVTPGSQTASTSTAGFTFGATGTYTVRLTVTDNLGATGTTTGTVTVSAGSSLPTARILVSPTSPAYDHDGNGNEIFVLSATASTVVGASIQNYLWSNGATGTTTSITVPIGITYPSLLITDTLGATSATSTSLTVFANPAPTAIITVTPNATVTDTDGDGMETLIVSGLNSYDQGTGTIATYQWNTGSTGATFSQAFSVTGSPHTVWLIVGDNVGATTYISQQIIVRAKTRGPGSASNGSTVWFAGKLYTQEQYIQILQAFYPNLIR